MGKGEWMRCCVAGIAALLSVPGIGLVAGCRSRPGTADADHRQDALPATSSVAWLRPGAALDDGRLFGVRLPDAIQAVSEVASATASADVNRETTAENRDSAPPSAESAVEPTVEPAVAGVEGLLHFMGEGGQGVTRRFAVARWGGDLEVTPMDGYTSALGLAGRRVEVLSAGKRRRLAVVRTEDGWRLAPEIYPERDFDPAYGPAYGL